MFGCMAMDIIQPLLLHAVEERLGQKPREVLEYLLKGYTRQFSKEDSETLQLSFESFFQLLSQAQEELGGQSWFDMFVTAPNGEGEKNHTGALSKKRKREKASRWFDFCCTQAADVTKTIDGAMMDVAGTGDKAKPAEDEGGYDPCMYSSWFGLCYTQAADVTTRIDGAEMDVAVYKAKPGEDEGGYDPRMYFLMDLFSGLSL